MIKILLGNNEKLIPHGWKDITVKQYQKLCLIQMEDSEKSMIEIVEVFTGLPKKTVEDMDFSEFVKLNELVTGCMSNFPSKHNIMPSFKKGLRRYYLVKNLYKIKTGEFIKIENYLKKDIIQNLHKIIPILYTNKKHIMTEDEAKQMSIAVGLSAISFIKASVHN